MGDSLENYMVTRKGNSVPLSAPSQGTWTVTTTKCSPSLGTTASSCTWTTPEGEAVGGHREGGTGGQALTLCPLCLPHRFGRHSHDETSILAPLSQCCM